MECRGRLDAFIATCVIEHAPNIVGFLRATETLLRLAGVVILAGLDQRKYFAIFRSLTGTVEAIASFPEKRDIRFARRSTAARTGRLRMALPELGRVPTDVRRVQSARSPTRCDAPCETPIKGPESVDDAILAEESRRILGLPAC